MKMSANKLNQVIERMSTGCKINHAKDDVANYGIATNMTTKINAYQVAQDNCEMGLDLVTTAEASLSLIQEKLLRLRELQGQASNDTYSDESLKAINSEATAIVDELHRVYESAEYNGIKLFADNAVDNSATPATLSTETAQTRATVAVDEAKRVSNVTSFTSGETYYLTTADDLVALQNLAIFEKATKGVTFEQAADIDMSGVEFEGIKSFSGDYNGNGHTISNLKIDVGNYQVGLFCNLSGSAQNITLKNCDIKGKEDVGGIVGFISTTSAIISNCSVSGKVSSIQGKVGGIAGFIRNATITNCSVSGTVSSAGNYVGGIAGQSYSSTITNCSVSGTVTGNRYVGGLVGISHSYTLHKDCTVDAEVVGDGYVGGLCGFSYYDNNIEIKNTLVTGSVTGNTCVGGLIGTANYIVNLADSSVSCKVNGTDASTTGVIYGRTYSDASCSFTNVTYDDTLNPEMPLIGKNNAGSDTSGITPALKPTPASDSIVLQIGIGSDEDSQLAINTKFDLTGLVALCDIGLDTTTDFLTKIDSMLNIVSAKRTEFGAVSNRLESALDSIAVSYNNLVSSRSTIQDADIAELSSEYIHQQILQQASATLMASANQSPSVALQLLYFNQNNSNTTLRSLL